MSTPNPFGGSIPLGMNTPVGQSEWNVFLQRRAQLIADGMQRLGLAGQLSQANGTHPLAAFQATSLVTLPQEEARRQRSSIPVTEPEYNELLGAADFYGIENARTLDPNVLRAQIEEQREYLATRRQEDGQGIGAELYDTFATFLGSTGLNAVDAVVDASKRIPFLGDAIRKSEAVQRYQQGLAMLEEGFTGDMLDNERAAYEKFARPLQHFLGYSALVGVAAESVAATGFAGGVANPLIRGSLQGAGTGWLLEGGGEDPIAERALKVALFAGIQGAAEWGLPKIAARLRRSFPSAADRMVETPLNAQGGGPRVVDAEWYFVDEAGNAVAQGMRPQIGPGPRLLGPGPRPIGPGEPPVPPGMGLTSGEMAPGTFQAPVGTTTVRTVAPLTMEQAAADAFAATKRGTVLESPALPGFAKQPLIEEADVTVAAIASNPGQVSVIQGVGDTGATIRRFLQDFLPNGIGPQDFRAIERGGRTDILVADGRPITNKMAQEYKAFGMFRGQQATTSGGQQVIIEALGPELSSVRSLGSSQTSTVATAELMPGKSSMIADAAPEAYIEMKSYALSRMAQEATDSGLAPFDWFSEELATQLPRYIDEFLDMRGIEGRGARGTYTSLFTEARVGEFKTLAPEEFAAADELAAQVASEYTSSVVSGSRPLYLEEVAETKGMAWIPAPNAQGGSLRDLISGEETALESTEAAFQFLQHFNRTPPDYSPFSTVPVELGSGSVGSANPGSSLGPRHYMTEHDLTETATRSLDRMEAAMVGGGGGLPPSGPPEVGTLGPFDPRFLPGADETLGAQFQRLRTETPKTYDEVMQRFDNLALRAFEPMRNFSLAVEETLHSAGITKGVYWQHYSAVVQGRAIAHNEAAPLHREVNDALNVIRRKFIRDGTVTLIGEMPEAVARSAMANAGYTEREVAGQLRLREILERLRVEYSEPGNEIRRIMDYMPHLRSRAAAGEDLGDLEQLFGGQGKFFAEQIRQGGIDVREMNASVLLHRWVRAATVNRYVSNPVNEMASQWVHDPRIPRELREITSDWLELITVGHTPGQDVIVPGIRHALNALKIPVTNAEVARGLNWIMTSMYRGALGGRPDVIVRDLLGPLFGGTRTGFGTLVRSYTQFFKGGAERQEMIDLALQGGWMERGMVPMGASEMFQGEYGMIPGVETAPNTFSPMQNMLREGVARAGDLARDALPTPIRSGLQGTKADPLYLYTKEGEFNRMISGHSGYLAMRDAIEVFEAARIAPDADMKALIGQLLRQSSAANYSAPIQRRIGQLVMARQYDEAMNTFANEVANSQFRYGTAEQSLLIRRAGVVGRYGSTFGTFTQQYIGQSKEALLDGGLISEYGGSSVDRVRSGAGYLARQSMVASALGLATAATAWNFGKWYWHGSLGWGGGPMLMAFITKTQELTGKFNIAQGEPNSPMQRWAVEQSKYTNQVSPFSNLNPYAGTMRTMEGLGQTFSSANPLEGSAQFVVTGKRESGDIMRDINDANYQVAPPPFWAPSPPWAQGQVPPPQISLRQQETTRLVPEEENAFQQWVRVNGIRDVDHPESFYDYRGYWKDVASRGEDQRFMYPDGLHFPDTYKQHGHPTFSIESRYSRGPQDGGRWQGETYIPQGYNPGHYMPQASLWISGGGATQ